MTPPLTTRRNFLAGLMATVPALAVAPSTAQAWTSVTAQDVGLIPATGTWGVLEHVTDGTDPAPTLIAPPVFTADIHKLAGSEITLIGYMQPVSGGFGGAKNYLLSRGVFHCPYCYVFGRGSLVLAKLNEHATTRVDKKVTVCGTLALQDKDPSDFYFQLTNARIVT